MRAVRGECVSVCKKLPAFSSVLHRVTAPQRLPVAGPLDSGDLLLSGPARQVVRPSVPFWGQSSAQEKRGGPDPSTSHQHCSASLGVHTWTKDEKRRPQPRARRLGEDTPRPQQALGGARGQCSQTHRPALSPQGTCGTVGSGCGQMPACALGSSHHPSVRQGVSVFRAGRGSPFACSVTEVP